MILIYVMLVPLTFLVSLVGMLTASKPETRKTFKTLMLISLGLLVLGGGLCALFFANLGDMH